MSNPVLNALGDELLYGGQDDPTVVPIDAPRGAVYIFAPTVGALAVFQKQDNGATTNWNDISVGGAGKMDTDFGNAVASAIDLDLGSNQINNLADPTLAQDASTKNYTDTQDALLLPLTGGTMSGAINMGSNQINAVTDPTLAQDAATKNYVDTEIAGISGFANDTLSNLASPTAINQDLLPDAIASWFLGSPSQAWFGVHASVFFTTNGAGTTKGNFGAELLTPSGVTTGSSVTIPTAEGSLGLYTDNSALANADATGDVLIESGNKLAGTGDSGSIIVTPGTSSGGTRGTINFVDGTEGTPGDVWTSTGASGEGSWATPSAGANTALSNLASVAINTTLLPGVDGAVDLGDGSNRFGTIQLRDSIVARLYDSAGTQTVVFQTSTGLPNTGTGFLFTNTKDGEGIALVTEDNSSVDTGPVQLETGDANAATTDSGAVSIRTGAKSGGSTAGTTGDISISTGTFAGAAAGVSTGNINIFTGTNPNGTRGDISLTTNVLNTSSEGASNLLSDGLMTVGSDDNADTNATPTSNTLVQTGDKTSGTGDSGDILLTTGSSSGGDRGDIVMSSLLVDMSSVVDGLVWPVLAADPTNLTDGQVWYDSTTDEFKGRANGATVTFTVT